MSTKVVVGGQLAEQAIYFMRRDQVFVVLLLIQVQGEVVLVEWAFGEGSAGSHAAGNAASSLRKGTEVVAHGCGLTRGKYRNEWHPKLIGVGRVDRPMPAHFTDFEPAALAA